MLMTTTSPWRWVPLILMAMIFRTTASSSIDGRYSFSLTTFDPSGKLGQVERAIIASSLGTPIIAAILPVQNNSNNEDDRKHAIIMASPQILPSPFLEDDGTSRFTQIAPHIVMGHSGISADGRALIKAAQRLAVEHSYTFEEPVPIELFLEELSLLMQQYTMKPGSRPFGSTLLVAYVPPQTSAQTRKLPKLYRIDPSGSVIAYEENYAIVNGKSLDQGTIERKLKEMMTETSTSSEIDKYRNDLKDILNESMSTNGNRNPSSNNMNDGNDTDGDNIKIPLKTRIISASFSGGEESSSSSSGFVIERK